MKLNTLTIDDLTIRDERAFRHIALYDTLKQLVRTQGARFYAPPKGALDATWDRVVFLNLTYWVPGSTTDVLVDESIDADVVAHVAWHHAAYKNLPQGSADAHFLGEAIASAFDVYLVGRTLGRNPECGFLETQVPAMAEVASASGLSDDAFEALLLSMSSEPERAFEDLRALLFDVTTTLVRCADAPAAALAFERFEKHRFAPLLHHFELSSWILYAKAMGAAALEPDPAVRAVDAALRAAPVALDWLEQRWLGVEPDPVR
jgi:hypothetical protein